MTTPALSKTVKGKGRHYTSPLTGVDGPSVTNCLVAEKPAIAWWQTKGALRAAWEDREAFSRMQDVETAVKAYQSAAFKQRDKAADVGSDVHAVCEALAGDGDLPGLYRAEARPFVDQFLKAVSALDIEPVEVERSVWNETYRYGGTFDLYAMVGGVRTLIDLKTGKGVYPEAAWQLAGLNAGEVYADDGEPYFPAKRLAVLHLTPESWALHEVDDPALALRTFLGLRQAWDGVKGNGAAFSEVSA